MKVGIIIHSHSGNTLSVAEKLKKNLVSEGHSVNLEQVIAVNEDPSASANIQLKIKPDPRMYDILIFGAPVRGLSLSPVMKLYLSEILFLQGKKVGCFVTQFFPYPWMGGNRSISQMKKSCESKGIQVYETGIVNWSSKKRQIKISSVIKKLSNLCSHGACQ